MASKSGARRPGAPRPAGATSSSAAGAPGSAAPASGSPEEREKEMAELVEKLKKAAAAPEQASRRVSAVQRIIVVEVVVSHVLFVAAGP